MTIDELLKKVKTIHFIGIGGSGMCPLAEILISWGYDVRGSDNNPGDNLEKLKSLGAKIIMGQSAANITGAQMIVYTAALLPNNVELVAAKSSGIPTFERSKLFGAISRMYSDCVCVCGTHGKTTTTSLLSQILIMAGKDPTTVIGGKLPLIDSHGRAGKSELMVCEACEFKDTFLDLSPDIAVILNVDEDHLDYFKNLDNIIASFRRFSEMTSKTIIFNGDDENTKKAVEGIEKEKYSFGFNEGNDYYPANISFNRGAFPEFDVVFRDEIVAHLKLNIPGRHNILNSLAAFAAAKKCGCSASEIENGAAAFNGAGRRFEILGEVGGVTVADDYAHHPAELEAILSSVKEMGYNTVWALFQPFTYSRTAILLDDFARVLKIPDRCVMTEIMAGRETNTYNIYTKDLADRIPGSVWYEGFEGVTNYIVENIQPGDIVITLGCGDIYKAARMIFQRLKEKQ